MPERPSSKAQLGFVHAEANRGTPWAQRTVREWHGKRFGQLPERKSTLSRVRERMSRR